MSKRGTSVGKILTQKMQLFCIAAKATLCIRKATLCIRKAALYAVTLFFISGCDKLKDPAVPVIVSVSPASPSFDRTPTVSGTSDADLQVELYSGANCSGTFLGRSRSDSSGRFSITAQALAEGSYTFSVQVINDDSRTACSSTTIIYSLDISAPTISLTAPSSSLVSSGSAAVNFSATYTGVMTVNLTSADVTLNTTGTATCSSKVVTSGTTVTPTISLSNCTGSGTVGFTIAYGTAYDDVGNSTQATSGTFAVDNSAITSAVFSPSTSVVGSIPTSATVTFSKPVNGTTVTAADFMVSGTCTPLPTLSVTSTAGATSNLALTATACGAVGETVTVAVNLSGIQDPAGTSGVGSASATYTLDNLGPTSATFLPVTAIVSAAPAAVTVTYSESITPASVSNADFSVSGTCTTLPTINVSNASATAAMLSVSGGTCTNAQTFVVTANFAGISDTAGNFGSSNSSVTYTFDTIGPAALTLSPSSMATSSIPTTATINFDDTLAAASVAATDLVITGTCSILPVASVLSVIGTAANFSLSAATCASGETVILNLSGSSVTDTPGNSGTGSVNSVLTFDSQGPVAVSVSPATSTVNAPPAMLTATFSEGINAGSVTASDLVISGTCATLPAVTVSSVAGSMITFSLAGAVCANGATTVALINGSAVTDAANNTGSGSVTVTYTIDSVGPTPSAITPVGGIRMLMPTTVTATFDDSVLAASVAASDLGISGTCSGLPTASVASVSGASINFNLSSATCAHAETLVLTIQGANVTDSLGNTGSGTQSVTYTTDTVAPSLSSFSPASSAVLSVPFTVAATFSESVNPASVSAADLSVSGTCTTLPTASINSVSGAVVSIGFAGASCAHNQFVLLTVNMAGISDSAGNFGSGTASVTYTLDNVGPTLVSFNPAGGAPPLSVDIQYSETLNSASVDPADFNVTSSCISAPTITAASAVGNLVTLTLSAATCLTSQTVQISSDASLVTDSLGNVGSGTSTVTYTQP